MARSQASGAEQPGAAPHHRSGARNPVQLAGAGDSGRALSGLFRRQRRIRLEALSRYAGSATLLEFERPVAQQLEKSGAAAGQGVVINTNALSWLAGEGQPFDVVFLDPPFRKGLLAETALLLEQRGWLADEAWIYVEAEAESAAADVPASWQLHRESRRPGGLSPLYSFARKNRPC